MANLGSFGAAVRELNPDGERDTFDFFGERFTVHATIPPMLMLRLGAFMAGELGSIEDNAVVYKALRHALTVPADPATKTRADSSQFDRFEKLALAKMCDSDELVKLVFALVGIQIAFPTEQQPTSPDGLQGTSEGSSSSASESPDSPTSVSASPDSAG
jgi:hypothetical protein